MRSIVKLLLSGLVFTAALSLGACVGKAVDSADLLHHNFVLAEVNGQPFSGEKKPNIQFNEGMRVSGAICNNYTGQGELAGGKLYVRQLASTKMLCFEQGLNELEFAFGNMLMNGAEISYRGNTLTLSGEGRVLKFELRDYVN